MRARDTALLILTFPIALLTAQQPGPTPESRANFFTVDKEIALGNQIASEIRKQTRAIEDAKISEYVDALGQRLARAIPGTKFPFTFNVVAGDSCPTMHEAESLPGGNVFVVCQVGGFWRRGGDSNSIRGFAFRNLQILSCQYRSDCHKRYGCLSDIAR